MKDECKTPYEIRCELLGDIWLEYKGKPDYEEFIYMNDLVLSLAFGISTMLVMSTPKIEPMINDTFNAFLELIGKTDEGFESFDHLFGFESDD